MNITIRLLLTLGLLAFQDPTDDPGKDLKSKDVETRLAAVAAIALQGGESAEKFLLRALGDDDWEVAEQAAIGLGQHGGEKALKPLVKMALEAPARRMRRRAAQAAGQIDGPGAAEAFLKKASGKTAQVASECFVDAFAGEVPGLSTKAFEKLLKGKNDDARVSSAQALVVATDGAERARLLEELLQHDDLIVRAGVLDQVTASAQEDDLAPLCAALAREQAATIERRLLRATLAALRAGPADRIATVLDATSAVDVLARRARFVELTSSGELLAPDAALEALAPCLAAKDPGPRAAAVKALRTIGGDAALAAALAHFESEGAERVRYQCLESVLALRGVNEEPALAWVAARLSSDPAASVRERAAVALGVSDLEGARKALTEALSDPDWHVAVSAAVSLGKTRSEAAVDVLHGLTRDEDWKRRGAAVVAFGHLNRRASIEPLLAALEDPVPAVSRSAHEALRAISDRYDVAQDLDAWKAWWAEVADRHRFVDKVEQAERNKRFGYEVPDVDIYKGLDVIVFESAGDHVQNVLARLDVEHRLTAANQLPEVGLHPGAVYVSNCTGEIEAGDVEPLEWFVHTGGSLFASCWALTHTIERVVPGVLKKAETPGEVLDDVRAWPCAESGFLTGVFPDEVVPIYHLEGAHLIEVLDPERAEVLIDSPDAAQRHGSGELAAWFPAGHGTVLDSVNHFDLQGLQVAIGLKKPAEVQAYAVDHMGLDYAGLREIAKEKFWKSASSASRHVPDLSAFRFVTNFVRAKRIR